MQTMKYTWITGFLLASLVFRSYAQEGPGARIYFAEGGEFVLAAGGGERIVYRPDTFGDGGLGLHHGDIIQTGSESFVEVLLTPDENVIKIAEHTFLSYNMIEGAEVSLGLSYGRLRLSNGTNGSGGGAVFIRSEIAEVVFRNGDIGVDYIVQEAGEHSSREPVLRVYVFSGSLDVFPIIQTLPAGQGETASPIPRLQVHEGETILIEKNAPFFYVERNPLATDIKAYWDHHTSAAFSLLSREETVSEPENPDQVPSSRAWNMSTGYNPFIKTNVIKNVFLLTGLSFSAAGAALQGVALSHWNFDNADNRTVHLYAGYGFLGLGILSFGAALFINPKIPVLDAAK